MNKENIQEASKILFEHRLNKTGLSSLKNLELWVIVQEPHLNY